MGEEIGSEMALRTFGHLVSYTTLLAVNLFSFISECFVVALSHPVCVNIHVFSKMKSALTSVLHLILLTHITPPFILILVLILKEFVSVICIQGCNGLSRQFIYLETHFCSCIFLIYAVMNFHFLSLHFISCVTVSPPWGERCPWPLPSFLCLTRVWTS